MPARPEEAAVRNLESSQALSLSYGMHRDDISVSMRLFVSHSRTVYFSECISIHPGQATALKPLQHSHGKAGTPWSCTSKDVYPRPGAGGRYLP